MRFSGKQRNIIIFIFALALAVRLIYSFAVFDDMSFAMWMPKQFDERAMLLVNGGERAMLTGWASYHVILAGFYKVFDWVGVLGYRFQIILIINAFLGALSCLLVFFISRHLFRDRFLSLIVSGIYISYYPAVYLGSLNVSENFFIPLFLAFFYLNLNLNKKNFIWHGILSGISLGLCIILRPVVIPFLPFWLIWTICHTRKEKFNFKEFVKYFVFLVFFCLIVVLLTSFINQKFDKHDKFGFTSNGGINSVFAWCRPKTIEYALPDGEHFWFSAPLFMATYNKTISTDVPFYNQVYYYRMAFGCIKENPERLFSNFGYIKNLWRSLFYPDFLSEHNWHNKLLEFWRILSFPLLIVLFFLFPFLHKTGRREWLLGFSLLLSLWVALYVSQPGEERYLISYYFVLLVWGIPSAIKVWKWLLKRS